MSVQVLAKVTWRLPALRDELKTGRVESFRIWSLLGLDGSDLDFRVEERELEGEASSLDGDIEI